MGIHEHEHGEPAALDVDRIREDFPILERRVGGDVTTPGEGPDDTEALVYLDNAATSQTPRPVVEEERAGKGAGVPRRHHLRVRPRVTAVGGYPPATGLGLAHCRPPVTVHHPPWFRRTARTRGPVVRTRTAAAHRGTLSTMYPE